MNDLYVKLTILRSYLNILEHREKYLFLSLLPAVKRALEQSK